MKQKWSQIIGVVILLAGAGGVTWLFRGKPVSDEDAPAALETVVPVRIGHVERRTLHGYVQGWGTVIPDPGIGAGAPAALTLTSPLDGLITEVNCRLGQSVETGRILFRLDDRVARQTVERRQKDVTVARANLERQRQLMDVSGTSDKLFLEAQQQFDQASSDLTQARTELSRYQVKAPSNGTIMAVHVRAGQTVAQAEPLTALADLDRLVVRAGVPQTEAAAIHPGQAAALRPAQAVPDDPVLTGQIAYVDPQVDPDNGTVAVLISLPEKSGLGQGQFVGARITVLEHPDCLAVPAESVVTTEAGQTVVAVVQGDEAVSVPVQRGLTEDAWAEVTGDGLTPGTVVVTTGAYGLPDRTRIRIMEE